MNSNERGFTLVELLVVVGMIAVIMGAISVSYSAAQQRARIQKATSDVKVISQAILAYENYARSNNEDLPTMTKQTADASSLGILIGKGKTTASGDKIPVLLMAALQNGREMKDPWGTPYRVTIKEGTIPASGSISLETGYYLPNFYRTTRGERGL